MNPAVRCKPIRFRDSRLIKAGVVLLVIGSGPLLLIIAAAKLGLTHDPDPNPVFFGILAGLTIWPAIIMIVVGIITIRGAKSRG